MTPAPAETLQALDRKRFATLQARAALASVTATLTEGDDGRVQVVVSRWALCRSFASLDELEDWLDRVGAPG